MGIFLVSSSGSYSSPVISSTVQVGWETLKEEFHKLMAKAKAGKDHDDIFDQVNSGEVRYQLQLYLAPAEGSSGGVSHVQAHVGGQGGWAGVAQGML